MNRPGPPPRTLARWGGWWWRSHSVRLRLTLSYVAAMVLVLGVYVFAVNAFVRTNLSEALDQQLRQDFVWVVASLYQTPDGTLMMNEPEQFDPEQGLPAVQVWTGDGVLSLFRNAEAERTPLPAEPSPTTESIVTIDADPAPIRVLTRGGGFVRRLGAVTDVRLVIQVARSEEAMRAQLREASLILMLGLPLAIAVAGLGGYVLARRALAPIERMTVRAQSITADRLSDRLPVDNPHDEMGRLASVFNETLARLQESFEQMRRFTADVSHELRTPLTAIRSVGEVGLRGQRDEAAYRAIIGSMLEEADRLATLVDRLLTLSRAETRQSKLSIEPLDLPALADDVAGHLAVLAEEKRQAIVVERHASPAVVADRLVVRQALINLVDNAIKFTPPGGQIRIRVSENDNDAIVDVIDSGPGVDAESQARIFDRFYRADGTSAAGTGLGLSIARGAIEANGGRLTLEETGPDGSTFRMTVPKAG